MVKLQFNRFDRYGKRYYNEIVVAVLSAVRGRMLALSGRGYDCTI